MQTSGHLAQLLVESYGGSAVENQPNLRNKRPEHFLQESSISFVFSKRESGKFPIVDILNIISECDTYQTKPFVSFFALLSKNGTFHPHVKVQVLAV